MVINKNQTSKKILATEKRNKIKDKFLGKINDEVENVDDSKSSKFVVDSPDLNNEYNKILENETVDINDARKEILNVIKHDKSSEEANQKKTSILHPIKKNKLESEEKSKKAKDITPKEKFKLKVPSFKNRPKISAIKLLSKNKKKSVVHSKILKANFISQLKILITTFLVFLFIIFIVLSVGLYIGKWQGPLVVKLTKIFHYPAVFVNGKVIKAETFLTDTDVLKNYLERQGIITENQKVRQETMDKLIEFEIVKNLVQENNLSLSDAEVESQLSILLENNDSTDIGLLTQELYGWSFDMYLEKVITPLLLKDKLANFFQNSIQANYVKETMDGLHKLVTNNNERFYDIAKEVNQDDSYISSGDLGWVKLRETSPEFELQLLNLTEGEISDVVETRYGYHIIKMEEKVVSNDESLFHVSHIFMKRPLFEDYLEEEIKKATIVTLIRI